MSGTGSLPDDPDRRLEEILAEHRDEPQPEDQAPEPFDPFAPLTADENEDENEGDEDSLPDAPLFSLLRTIQRDIGVDRIHRIWVFPPRRVDVGETSVVVVAAYPDLRDDDRRRVYAAHYTAHADADAPRLALHEYGTAPTERVGRLVEEVVERIKEGPAEAPRSHLIEGSDPQWHAVLHDLAEAWLEEVQKNPRLRR